MGSVKGTKTEQNLLKSFAGESQASNRYDFAAKVAKKEGFEQISAIFQETANHERQHAKNFFRFLEGGGLEITATYPAGVIDNTLGNLKAAAAGENEEWTELYPAFAATAKEEGFPEIAALYRAIAKVEEGHDKRYTKLIESLENGAVFEKDGDVYWFCRKCGYIHKAKVAPNKCPACNHPQGYFEVKADNY